MWYLRCTAEHDWKKGTLKINIPGIVDNILLAGFEVKRSSHIPASPAAKLGPTTDDYVVANRPFRQAVAGVMWLAGMTRPDIADAARAVAH